MVVLKVPNEEELLIWYDKIGKIDSNARMFAEPDIGNQPTACAAVGDQKLSKMLRSLKLL